MPTLADAIRQLESGGTAAGVAANARQNPTMVFPEFGQYQGFVSQYGGGETGINNFANQTLAANPNATFGDLYAGYVRGTGTPGAFTLNDLAAVNTGGQAGAQGAFTNLMTNSPIPADTPLSQLVSGNGTIASSGVPDGGGAGFNFTPLDVRTVDPTFAPTGGDLGPNQTFANRFDAAFPAQGGSDSNLFFNPQAIGAQSTFGGDIPSSDLQGRGTASIAQAAGEQTTSQVDANAIAGATSGTGGNISGTGQGMPIQIGPQPGLTALVNSAVKDVESAFGSMAQKILSSGVAAVTNYFGITGNLFVRFGLIVLGVVIIAIALSKLLGGPNLKDVAAAAATAARAA
jgi:hypothetical protein